MLELPVLGAVPFDDEVRRSFLQGKVSPVSVRKPDAIAVPEFMKIAQRLSGIKVVEEVKPKQQGFFAKLFAKFKKK